MSQLQYHWSRKGEKIVNFNEQTTEISGNFIKTKGLRKGLIL